MAITSALVLFAVIWFMLLFMALPIGMRSQEQEGDVVPGTPSSAPVNPDIGRKVIWVTIITFILWIPLVWLITSGTFSIRDIDFYHRMSPRL